MQTIGLLGGMSWESTVTYYQIINQAVKERLGGLHSARCILYSVEFDEIERCQSSGDWARSGEILAVDTVSPIYLPFGQFAWPMVPWTAGLMLLYLAVRRVRINLSNITSL